MLICIGNCEIVLQIMEDCPSYNIFNLPKAVELNDELGLPVKCPNNSNIYTINNYLASINWDLLFKNCDDSESSNSF